MERHGVWNPLAMTAWDRRDSVRSSMVYAPQGGEEKKKNKKNFTLFIRFPTSARSKRNHRIPFSWKLENGCCGIIVPCRLIV